MKPKAVLISDVHFNINTLHKSEASVRLVVSKAKELDVPLIIAGDLHDTKANLRAECVNALVDLFPASHSKKPYILIGNHDKINEKSTGHSLNFLSAGAQIIDEPAKVFGLYLVPYFSEIDKLREHLKSIPENSTAILHQGIQGSDSGEYYQDHTALKHEDVAHLNCISGHYHNRQSIDTGAKHTYQFIGNPYTLGFGEAYDPEKGFQILMDDGSLEFFPTGLPKHVIIDVDLKNDENLYSSTPYPGDYVWVKVRGTKAQTSDLTKEKLAKYIQLDMPFKMDIFAEEQKSTFEQHVPKSQEEILDGIIDSLSNTGPGVKDSLKALWRGISK